MKGANKTYNHTGHEYELTMTNGTMIEPVTDDGEAPKMSYDFKTIDKLFENQPNSIVDVIGMYVVELLRWMISHNAFYTLSLRSIALKLFKAV